MMAEDFDTTKPSVLAPGMTQPVVAGETYTIVDDNGEALVLEGRDDPLTVEFASAFDSWLTMKGTAGIANDADMIAAAWSRVMEKFEQLPQRIKDQLPSNRVGQVIVP